LFVPPPPPPSSSPPPPPPPPPPPTQHQAVDYTPWEGLEAHGRAHLVYVGGELVARNGEPTGATPGRYVAR
ncbi:hypothetical protein ACULPN_02585, partial [Thermophilibacter sp. ZX-H10]